MPTERPESVERLDYTHRRGRRGLAQTVSRGARVPRSVRASEYHITNACNLRCRGCWFFTFAFDKATKDETDAATLRDFIERERARHINAALLIGGEPTLVPDRVMAFVERMEYVTISTNGLRPLPPEGFER